MALNLSKGQTLSLVKDLNGGRAITSAQFGLGWQLSPAARHVDLDASAVLLNAAKEVVDTVWFRNPQSKCGSVKSAGDNQTGSTSGDAEVISVDLNRVPSSVSHIVFTVTSFSGQKLSVVSSAYVRVVDGTGKELGRYQLTEQCDKQAMIMAQLVRQGGEWQFEAIGEGHDARLVAKLIPFIQARI